MDIAFRLFHGLLAVGTLFLPIGCGGRPAIPGNAPPAKPVNRPPSVAAKEPQPIQVREPIPNGYDRSLLVLGQYRYLVGEHMLADCLPLPREIWRQAFLIAAEHEMGLATYDGVLCEPPPPSLTQRYGELRMRAVPASGVEWRFLEPGDDRREPLGGRVVAASPYTATPTFFLLQSRDPMVFARPLEPMSRGEFVRILKELGYRGSPLPINPRAALPSGIEERLSTMNLFAQFAALRQLQETLRTQGESADLLGGLVRCYANLAVLSECLWSSANRVFRARAMLYGERLLVRAPRSLAAGWDRAYGFALVGLHQHALDELERAEKLNGKLKVRPPVPPWVALLGPYCRFDGATLRSAGQSNPAIAGLAALLEFLTAEVTAEEEELGAVGQVAIAANPDCYRIHEGLFAHGSFATRGQLAESAPPVFFASLPARLRQIPGLPAELKPLLDRFAAAPDLPMAEAAAVA